MSTPAEPALTRAQLEQQLANAWRPELAVLILFTVTPSDRALAGWGISGLGDYARSVAAGENSLTDPGAPPDHGLLTAEARRPRRLSRRR